MTCLGRCCAAFPLSHDLDYLWLNAHRIIDGAQIAAMLIPLEPGEARLRLAAVDSTLEVRDQVEYFTCRHWDETTRLCTIYDQRPRMCRAYAPSSCDHGCQATEAA